MFAHDGTKCVWYVSIGSQGRIEECIDFEHLFWYYECKTMHQVSIQDAIFFYKYIVVEFFYQKDVQTKNMGLSCYILIPL
jgi:hypothetical protein